VRLANRLRKMLGRKMLCECMAMGYLCDTPVSARVQDKFMCVTHWRLHLKEHPPRMTYSITPDHTFSAKGEVVQTTVETIVSLYLSGIEENRISNNKGKDKGQLIVHLRDTLAGILNMPKGQVTFLDQGTVPARDTMQASEMCYRFRVYPPVMSDLVPGVLSLQSRTNVDDLDKIDPAAYITRAFYFDEGKDDDDNPPPG